MDGSREIAFALAARHNGRLALDRVSHVFGDGPERRRVLDEVSLAVGAGEIVILNGPSGCGKSTLLTLAGGLRAVQSGSLKHADVELAGASEGILRRQRRRVGFIFQGHNLHASLTALGNVRMGLEVQGPRAMEDWRARCRAMLDKVGLSARADDYPSTLSGVEKQRVAIARALVADPPLVLADEATAALDGKSGRDIVELIRTLVKAANAGALMVTHDQRILDVADRVVSMADGRVWPAESGRDRA
jgi:putative ABC transport system ATP-binding protein